MTNGEQTHSIFYKERRDENFLQKRPTRVAQRVPRVAKIRNVRSSRDKQPGAGQKATGQLRSGQKSIKQPQNKKVLRPKNVRNSKYNSISERDSQSRESHSQEHFEPCPLSRENLSQSSQSRDSNLIKAIWGRGYINFLVLSPRISRDSIFLPDDKINF